VALPWLLSLTFLHLSFSQDTVVALQALSKYGAATFTRSQKEVLVTIESSGTFSKTFHVNSGNRLLLQEVRLPDLPGNYVTKGSGSGCVYLQVRLLGPREWACGRGNVSFHCTIKMEICAKVIVELLKEDSRAGRGGARL
jgi:hypothetical protein